MRRVVTYRAYGSVTMHYPRIYIRVFYGIMLIGVIALILLRSL